VVILRNRILCTAFETISLLAVYFISKNITIIIIIIIIIINHHHHPSSIIIIIHHHQSSSSSSSSSSAQEPFVSPGHPQNYSPVFPTVGPSTYSFFKFLNNLIITV
jgi:hypothetical protein